MKGQFWKKYLPKFLPVLVIFALLFGANPMSLFAQHVATGSALAGSEVFTAPVVAAEEGALQNPDATCVVVNEATAPPKVDVRSTGMQIFLLQIDPRGGGNCQTPQYSLIFPSELFTIIGTPEWVTSEGPIQGGACTISPEGWTISCPAISVKVPVYVLVMATPMATGSGAITISRNVTIIVSNSVEVAYFIYLPVTVKGGGRGG